MKLLTKARRRVKLSHDERMRRLRLGDLRKLFSDRCHGIVLSDDDAGRDYLRELLLPISLGPNEATNGRGGVRIWGPIDRMLHEIELRAPWMTEDEAQELIDEINLSPTWQRKPMARTLGERLHVPYGERARLGLRTIGCYDMTEEAMEALRKQRRRKQDKLRRQRQPRPEYLAAHKISKDQPWIVRGISRATWYRQRETSVPHINLTKTSCIPVSEVKNSEESKVCGRNNHGFCVANSNMATLNNEAPQRPLRRRRRI
jgi:hypothetical protein